MVFCSHSKIWKTFINYGYIKYTPIFFKKERNVKYDICGSICPIANELLLPEVRIIYPVGTLKVVHNQTNNNTC